MRTLTLLCLVAVLSVPSVLLAQHSVILDNFNGRYYPPGTGPGGPQHDWALTKNQNGDWRELWDWVYWGFGPPAYTQQETGLKLDPQDSPPDTTAIVIQNPSFEDADMSMWPGAIRDCSGVGPYTPTDLLCLGKVEVAHGAEPYAASASQTITGLIAGNYVLVRVDFAWEHVAADDTLSYVELVDSDGSTVLASYKRHDASGGWMTGGSDVRLAGQISGTQVTVRWGLSGTGTGAGTSGVYTDDWRSPAAGTPPNASASQRFRFPYYPPPPIGDWGGHQCFVITDLYGAEGVDFAQILSDLGEPEIDWRLPVRFEVDVYGHNADLETPQQQWQQGILIRKFEGNDYWPSQWIQWGDAPLPNQVWQVATSVDLIATDPNNPDTLFYLALFTEFWDGPPRPAGQVSTAIWENLRIVYTPLGPPVVLSVDPDRGAALFELPQVSVTFSELVTGVTADDLTINGTQATGVSGSGAGPYVFTINQGALPTPPATLNVVLAADPPSGIQDVDLESFEGDSWSYELLPPPDICDFDQDGDVDMTDLSTLTTDCYSGPGGGILVPGPEIDCNRPDVDDDNDVDLIDFATFQAHFTG